MMILDSDLLFLGHPVFGNRSMDYMVMRYHFDCRHRLTGKLKLLQCNQSWLIPNMSC